MLALYVSLYAKFLSLMFIVIKCLVLGASVFMLDQIIVMYLP